MGRTNSTFLILLLCMTTLNAVIWVVPQEVSAFAGGDGTPGDPFQIANVIDLQNMSANLSAHYVLINDIDASATSGWNGGDGFVPIGNSGTRFTGSLDGRGYAITGLYIFRPGENSIGLFGYVGSGARIANVSMEDVDILGHIDVGGLIGWNSGGDITNCTAYGNTDGDLHVGGLIGGNRGGDITNCTAYGNTTGNNWVGGLIGWHDGGIVTNCTAYGDTTGDTGVGGLIGQNGGTVTYCTAYGDTTGMDRVGGLIGRNPGIGMVTNCTAYGNTNGDLYVGGLIGLNDVGIVTNCTAYGNTTGNFDWVGGLIGQNRGSITNCTAYGNTNGGRIVGGLIGWNWGGDIINCTAYGNTTGEIVGGLIGYNDGGIVTNCTAYGRTTGDTRVGGLIGYNNAGTVTECFSNNSITGNNTVGGLIGDNRGIITNCYSHSTVSGNLTIGGLIGSNTGGGTVTDCYSKGNVTGNSSTGGLIGNNTGGGAVTDCFWDNETSGWNTSDGGIGKCTEEMMNVWTYFGKWDFATVWEIEHTVTYPYFKLQDRNYDPLAINDSAALNEDSPFSMASPGLLANDLDPNFDPLTVVAFDNPSTLGAAVDVAADGGWSYDPTSVGIMQSLAVGEYLIDTFNYTVSDGHGGTANATVYINVTGVNDDPIITTADVTKATTGTFYETDYEADDVDGDAQTWSLDTDASWLSIDIFTGVLSGTPSIAGRYWVNVTVEDGNGGADSTNFTLTVELDTAGGGTPDAGGGIPPLQEYKERKQETSPLGLLLILLSVLIIISIILSVLITRQRG
ncbi:MAG: cadherin-like domain-containing protein [Thermoplasmata archaeon]|nr:MAG: cadherin-like domain-containing protein [Thermoplasmata archaeon]